MLLVIGLRTWKGSRRGELSCLICRSSYPVGWRWAQRRDDTVLILLSSTRLKQDILKEAARYGGMVLVQEEIRRSFSAPASPPDWPLLLPLRMS